MQHGRSQRHINLNNMQYKHRLGARSTVPRFWRTSHCCPRICQHNNNGHFGLAHRTNTSCGYIPRWCPKGVQRRRRVAGPGVPKNAPRRVAARRPCPRLGRCGGGVRRHTHGSRSPPQRPDPGPLRSQQPFARRDVLQEVALVHHAEPIHAPVVVVDPQAGLRGGAVHTLDQGAAGQVGDDGRRARVRVVVVPAEPRGLDRLVGAVEHVQHPDLAGRARRPCRGHEDAMRMSRLCRDDDILARCGACCRVEGARRPVVRS